MSRTKLVYQLIDAVGPAVIRMISEGDGWPSILRVQGINRPVLVALHISRIGSHARAPYERRFQNPGNKKPVSAEGGAVPILMGVVENDKAASVVVLDGTSRVGRQARFSILFHERILREARTFGWAGYISNTGEEMFSLRPKLLPLAVSAISERLEIPQSAIVNATRAAGLLDDDSEGSAERVRRSAQVLVRDHRFGRAVIRAYDDMCAMCGLDLGCVVGAHIYPASAPESPDRVWNGLALCPNHHWAFDQHKIWVEPGGERRIRLHESILANSEINAAAKAFVNVTHRCLSVPRRSAALPREEMFQRRYAYYGEQYNWV